MRKKRKKREASKETPKGAAAKKESAKPRKITEAKKKTPISKGSKTTNKVRLQGKKESEVAGQLQDQGDELPQDQGREVVCVGEKAGSGTADPDTYFWPYYYLSPHLPRRPADIERRRKQAQDPQIPQSLRKVLSEEKERPRHP